MTSTTKTHETSGSRKLLQSLSKNGEIPSSGEIIKTLNLPAGVTTPHWLVRGTPVNWLELSGTVQMPVSNLGAVIDSFVKLNDSSISTVLVRNTPGEI